MKLQEVDRILSLSLEFFVPPKEYIEAISLIKASKVIHYNSYIQHCIWECIFFG